MKTILIKASDYRKSDKTTCFGTAMNVLGYDGDAIQKECSLGRSSGTCVRKLQEWLETNLDLNFDFCFGIEFRNKRRSKTKKAVKTVGLPKNAKNGLLFTSGHVSAVKDGKIYDYLEGITRRKYFFYVEIPLKEEV